MGVVTSRRATHDVVAVGGFSRVGGRSGHVGVVGVVGVVAVGSGAVAAGSGAGCAAGSPVGGVASCARAAVGTASTRAAVPASRSEEMRTR